MGGDCSGYSPVASSCGHGNELLGSIKWGIYQLSNSQFLKESGSWNYISASSYKILAGLTT